jgi:hypothetical protein
VDQRVEIDLLLQDLLNRSGPRGDVTDQDIDRMAVTHPHLKKELEKLRLIVLAGHGAERSSAPGPAQGETPQPLSPAPPPPIPDYELVRLINRGGFGQVWLGRNRHTRRFHAVKLIAPSIDVEREGVRAYQQRVQGHPHLVPIEHVGDTGQFFYYTMPLADDANGTGAVCDPEAYEALSLYRYTHRQGPLSAEEVLTIGVNLALALEHLHGAGLLHKDVKPANVLRVRGCWQLGDMGLLTDAARREEGRGTCTFWPPEGPRERTADLYALGKTLFLLWTGASLERFPDFVRGSLPQTRPDRRGKRLRQVILRACHDDPARRYPTARAMLRDLNRIRSGGEYGWYLGAAAATILLALAICFLRPDRLARPAKALPAQEKTAPAAGLSGALTVLVQTPDGAYLGWRDLKEPGVLPVRSGYRVRLKAVLTQPAYICLIWLDSGGKAFPLYPWNEASIVRGFADPIPQQPPRAEVQSPVTESKGWRIDSHAGLETVLLLARHEPLPEDIPWDDLIGRLGPTRPGHPLELGFRGFDPGQAVPTLNGGQHRGIEKEAQEKDQELLSLMERLRKYFDMSRAVRFAHQAD